MSVPSIPTLFWCDRMDVYTVTEATGAYTTKSASATPCRLDTISTRQTTSTGERAELSAMRRLRWGPSYTMPDYAQVEIAGIRYNVAQGTTVPTRWPLDGSVIHYSADVVRVDGN